MLASITPLGERGRGQRWGVTVTAFVLGARRCRRRARCGARRAGRCGRPRRCRDVGAAAGARRPARAGAGLDAARRVPGPRRQVDERWLDGFRGWVYGLGFGAQLGAGFITVVTARRRTPRSPRRRSPGRGGAGGRSAPSFGLMRGVTPAAAARVRTPASCSPCTRRSIAGASRSAGASPAGSRCSPSRRRRSGRMNLAGQLAMVIEAHGIRVELPRGWSGRLFRADAATATLHVGELRPGAQGRGVR